MGYNARNDSATTSRGCNASGKHNAIMSGLVTVFHRTTQEAATLILHGGFRDVTGRYLTNQEWSGVWVADRPLDNSEGASGEIVLQIEIPEKALRRYEWIEEAKPYREWLVPASILNNAGTIKLWSQDPIDGPRS
jgi:hypothetical protein